MKEKNIKTGILFALVVAQFLGIACVNFTRSYGFMDYDTAFTVRQGVEMWRRGIFLKDFNYSTSMEIDCSAFFAAPIYILTDNLNLAMGITHCLFNALIIYLIFVIFSQVFPEEKTRVLNGTLLSVLFVFTPYASKPDYLDWSNMLFISAGYYEFRVISMLSLLGVMLMSENNRVSRRKYIVHLILSLIFNFWTSLSVGKYALGFIILPFVLKRCLDMIKEKRIVIISRHNFALFSVCALWVLSDMLRSHYGITSHRTDLDLVNAIHFWDNIQNMIVGIFLLFNGLSRKSGVSIFSPEGIAILLRFGMVCFTLILVWINGKKEKNRTTLFTTFSLVTLVNLGVFSLTSSTYGQSIFEHRYHIQWTYLLLIVVAYILVNDEEWKNHFAFRLVTWGTIGVLTLVNAVGFSEMFEIDKEKSHISKVLDYADLGQADSIIVYNNFELAGQIRAADLHKNSVSVALSGEMMSADYKYFSYTVADQSYTEGRNIFVCPQEEFERLPDYIKSGYELIYNKEWIGNFYIADESPFDAISGLPLETAERSVDFPYSPGYSFKGNLDTEGRLIAESATAEIILSGPYTNIIPGTYDITLYYQVEKTGETPNVFDICTQNGERILIQQALDSSLTFVTLDDVSFTGSAPLEFRVRQGAGGKMIIDRIEFVRVSK
ncbi:MAG: hypothetical protein IJZ85_11580 [Lachnospiraceae bacterium]|nr:hypothetical protein [Lachnospiraceae bacterium]